ncbi:MAG TPA: hypothetical protein VHO25_25515 [Polyangiaceae bacterium]|nr:hypothetical protein [Polyangiaceae bacterium]
MHATARESKPAPESEQSSVRRRQSATTLASASVAASASPVRSNLANKIATAKSLQTLVPEESREAQLLAIAILRRDEALLDELIRRVSRR